MTRRENLAGLLTVAAAVTAAISTVLATSWNVYDRAGVSWIWLGIATGASAIAAAVSVFTLRKKEMHQGSGRVFIIYARNDLDKAADIAEWLRGQGFAPWLDVEQIQPGARWKDAVASALGESGAALVVVTENLNASDGWPAQEIKQAMSTLRSRDSQLSPVIPVLMGGDKLPESMRDIQGVTFTDEQGRARLREGLQRVLAGGL